MGIVLDEVSFQGRAPPLRRITDKITQLSGLPVCVEESDPEIAGDSHGLHAHVSFACAPEERLKVFTYRPHAVKEFYEQFSQGLELPTARSMLGLNEPAGIQTVYLEGFTGEEPSLRAFTILALEALGGRSRQPIPEEVRRQYGNPISEDELEERRRKLRKRLGLAVLIHVLLLPVTVALSLLAFVATLVTLPWRIGTGWYQDAIDKRDHQELLRTIPDHMEFLPTKPADFPALDTPRLQQYTQALEALGFVHALDYTVRTNVWFSSGGFARLFIHPVQHCLAEVNQAFVAHLEPSSMRCMLGSLLEEGWDLSSTDREPTDMVMSYVWRRPSNLCSCHPQHTPAELLSEHLQRRQQMVETLHLRFETQLSVEGYFDYQRQLWPHRKAVLKSKSIHTIRREVERFERSPKCEWGDFGRITTGQHEHRIRGFLAC